MFQIEGTVKCWVKNLLFYLLLAHAFAHEYPLSTCWFSTGRLPSCHNMALRDLWWRVGEETLRALTLHSGDDISIFELGHGVNDSADGMSSVAGCNMHVCYKHITLNIDNVWSIIALPRRQHRLTQSGLTDSLHLLNYVECTVWPRTWFFLVLTSEMSSKHCSIILWIFCRPAQIWSLRSLSLGDNEQMSNTDF